MKIVCIFIVLSLGLKNTSAQPVIKSMAEAGRGEIFIYLGREVVSPSKPFENITAYKVERKESNKTNWSSVGEFQAPPSFDDFQKRFNEALRYFPQPHADSPVPLERIWKTISRINNADSIAPYNNYLPIMIALGYAAVDNTAKRNVNYHYRVSRQINSRWQPVFLTNTVSLPVAMKIPKPVLLRSFTESKSISLTYLVRGKNLPSYFRVMRRDNFTGEFRVADIKRFLNFKSDSLFVILHDIQVTAHHGYEYFLLTFDRAGNEGPSSDTALVASYNFNEAYLPHQIKTRNNKNTPGIMVSWRLDKPKLCKGLQLYRSLHLDKGFEAVADLLPTDTLYIDQHVMPMKRYYYHLRILGLLDETSVPSATVFGMYQDESPPLHPIYLQANTDPEGVRLSWSPGDEHVKGYYLYRGFRGNRLELISPLIADTFFVDKSSALSGTEMYAYALKAENTSHQISSFSDTVMARPGVPVYVQRPRALAAQLRNGVVNLSWLEMREYDNAISWYEISRSEDGRKYDALHSALEENNFKDSTIVPGKAYYYRVRSVNATAGLSDWSEEISIHVPVPSESLFPPAGFQALKGSNSVTLRWGGVLQEGVTGYKLYKRVGNAQATILSSLNSATYEYTDNDIQKGQRYFFFITTLGPGNRESERSNPVIITF